MPYHHGLERKKFDARQRALRRKYQQSGMSETEIQALYQFDLREFLDERRYQEHTQPFVEANISASSSDDGFSLHMWMEEISDPALANRLKSMTHMDMVLLMLYAIDGLSQSEIAQVIQVSQSTISRRLKKILQNLRKSA